jgi:hypothetical protein
MIIQDELQPVKLVMSRDYIYYSNTICDKISRAIGASPANAGWIEKREMKGTTRVRK